MERITEPRSPAATSSPPHRGGAALAPNKPALLGAKVRRGIPAWPIFDQHEEQALLRPAQWQMVPRQRHVKNVNAYATLTGAKQCLAANGTSALYISLNVLGVRQATKSSSRPTPSPPPSSSASTPSPSSSIPIRAPSRWTPPSGATRQRQHPR